MLSKPTVCVIGVHGTIIDLLYYRKAKKDVK